MQYALLNLENASPFTDAQSKQMIFSQKTCLDYNTIGE